ncbi:MAG: ABC transporter permease [Chloroflexi bacterium]|nr:ABC transporter permease [Chloroflexota bacterium]
MFQFALRRLSIIPLVLLIANFIGFAFAFATTPIVTASDPYSIGANELPPIMPVYFDYLKNMSKGDFGRTFTNEPVLENIARFGGASLGLIGIAMTISILLGLTLGLLAVRRSRSGVASWLTLLSTIGLALPSFYVAILLIAFFVLLTIYVSSSATPAIPFQGFGWDAHLILPVLTLVIQPTVKIAQVTAGLLSEELGKQYVTAALSFGHSIQKIKSKFAFRSILAPVALTIAGSLRIMIAELIIIERLFNWPGLGKLISTILSRSSQSADLLAPPMVAAILTVLVGIFLLIDFSATFFSRLIDPRLRADSELHFKEAAA